MKVYVTYATEAFDDADAEDFDQSVHRTPEGAERWLRENFKIPGEASFEESVLDGEKIWVYEASGGHPDLFGIREHELRD